MPPWAIAALADVEPGGLLHALVEGVDLLVVPWPEGEQIGVFTAER